MQDQEFSDGSGLNWSDTHYRQLDVQLCRWLEIDPKCEIGINPEASINENAEDESDVGGLESMSPYSSVGNDPILHNDPNGDLFGLDNLVGALVGAVVKVATQVVTPVGGRRAGRNQRQVPGIVGNSHYYRRRP